MGEHFLQYLWGVSITSCAVSLGELNSHTLQTAVRKRGGIIAHDRNSRCWKMLWCFLRPKNGHMVHLLSSMVMFQKDENDFVRLGGKWRISIASTVPYCYDNNRILQRVEKIEFLKLHLVVNVVSLAFGRCKLQCRSSISFTTQAKEVCSRKGLTPRIHLAFPISHLT